MIHLLNKYVLRVYWSKHLCTLLNKKSLQWKNQVRTQALGISHGERGLGAENSVLGAQTRARGQVREGFWTEVIIGYWLVPLFWDMYQNTTWLIWWCVTCFIYHWRFIVLLFVYTKDRYFNQVHFEHYLNYLPPHAHPVAYYKWK